MASRTESSTEGGLAMVQLTQVETNEEYSCELEVDPSFVVQDGQVLQDVCFKFLQTSADNDDTLTEDQAAKLHFVPKSAAEDEDQSTQTTAEDKRPVKKIVERLMCYAEDVEKKVREDVQLREETKKVLLECIVKRGIEETDSGEGEGSSDGGVTIDLKRVWSHIQEVFQLLLSDLTMPNIDAIRVLTRLGSGLGYCYYLIKQLVITYLESLTFRGVVDIMCNIVTFLMRHLVEIKFGELLRSLGGWNSLVATTVVDHGTRAVADQVTHWIPVEYILGAAGVVFIGLAVYKWMTRR